MPADPALRKRDEKLESLKAVVGKLAHDFNNFLAPQYGYLTMLKDEAPSGSTMAMYLTAMGTAAQRSENYVSAILLGMRPYRQFSPKEISLHLLLDEVLNRWMAETPKEKQVVLKRDLREFTFLGDEKHWRTALEHLLSNARFALAIGGELEVTLQPQKLDGSEVQRLGLSTESVMRLTVRDTGFGMSPETIERAFEPFFTTRTQIKAAGLGLTVVHGITLFHGGQIELQSVEDQGTTVTLWLPTVPVRQHYGNLSGTASGLAQRKVLLIEDDPLMKEVLRTWILQQGLDVEHAANLTEAQRSLGRNGSECVLILCETDLQSGPGEELYKSLVETYPAPAWVFMSGLRTPQFGGTPRRAEPLVIKKPFSHNAFVDLIRKYGAN